MKIKHPKEHDEIAQWIFDNPDVMLKDIDFKEPYTNLVKVIQFGVMKGKSVIGNFDVQFRFQDAEYSDSNADSKFDIYEEVSRIKEKEIRYYVYNFVINVKMESATEQLRELKKLNRQHSENSKGSGTIQRYVIVSKNDNFKSFFTAAKYIFYKY